MADEKNETPKPPPQPQNTAAPERPKVPVNRLVTGEGKPPAKKWLLISERSTIQASARLPPLFFAP